MQLNSIRVAALLAYGSSLLAMPNSALAESLTIEMSGQVGPALTAKIAEYGLPRTITLPPNKTLLSAVLDLCGSNPTYLALVGADRLYASKPVARQETIPACIRPASAIATSVKKNDTYTKILARYGISESQGLNSWPNSANNAIAIACADQGSSACKTSGGTYDSSVWKTGVADNGQKVTWLETGQPLPGLGEKIAAYMQAKTDGHEPSDVGDVALLATSHDEFTKFANRTLIDSVVPDPNLIVEGARVPVPNQKTEFSTVFLKPSGHAAAIVDDLRKTATIEGNPPPDIVDNPKDVLLVSPSDEGCENTPNDYRPFNGDEVVRQIGLNYRVGNIAPPEQRTNVLVLDTGFDEEIVKSGTPFPPQYFYRMSRPLNGESATAFNFNNASIFGYNFATHQDIAASPQGFPNRWHGLNVVGTVLGGTEFEDYRYSVKLPVGVAIGSLISFHGGEPKIEPNALSDSIHMALQERGGISIVNASFMAGRQIDGLADAASKASGVLLVVAAGNESRNLDSWSVWPARYGGEPANSNGLTTITVGGYAPDGSIWARSAWSEKYVDLLAPACRIPTYSGDESAPDQSGETHITTTKVVESGTSLSAPIVSMVAAILSSYKMQPYEIKQRLIFSSDFDPKLIDKVFSSGRLNVRRALAFPMDVVDWQANSQRKEAYFRSSFSSLSSITICGKQLRPKLVGKISRYARADGTEMVRYWLKSENTDKPELFDYKECALSETNDLIIHLTGSVAGQSDKIDIPIAQLVDFVPAASR